MDDMLPNDGSVFNPYLPTDDQSKEINKAQAEAESSYPILNDLITITVREIELADSIKNLELTSATSSQERDILFEGNARYVTLLERYLDLLKSMKETAESPKH
jgi:hypothetical protein